MRKTDKPKTLRAITTSNGARDVTANELKLTWEEELLVQNFRAIPNEKQEVYFDAIHDCANKVRSRKPVLRLVVGGAA